MGDYTSSDSAQNIVPIHNDASTSVVAPAHTHTGASTSAPPFNTVDQYNQILCILNMQPHSAQLEVDRPVASGTSLLASTT